ncbi:MAG: hypothetical protein QG552_479 [Thermodesulfobacteriota bacterium]|nr:hypothetical protein [Thermodesulfobacteriota bacterium]
MNISCIFPFIYGNIIKSSKQDKQSAAKGYLLQSQVQTGRFL